MHVRVRACMCVDGSPSTDKLSKRVPQTSDFMKLEFYFRTSVFPSLNSKPRRRIDNVVFTEYYILPTNSLYL